MTDTQHQRESEPGAMTTKHDSITTDLFGERVSVGQADRLEEASSPAAKRDFAGLGGTRANWP